MGKPIIVNGWLIEDLRSANSLDELRSTYLFLLDLVQNDDYIVVMKGEQMDNKIRNYLGNNFPTNTIQRTALKFFAKVVWSDPANLQLIPNVSSLDPRIGAIVDSDDYFLAKTYQATKDGIIVTTDVDLHSDLKKEGWNIKMRDDFFS